MLSLLSCGAGSVYALGLGDIQVRSALGQPFRANVDLLSYDASDLSASCFKVKLDAADGTFLTMANVDVLQGRQGKMLAVYTRQAVSEPALKVSVDTGCGNRIHREFIALLDPPMLEAAVSSNTQQALDARSTDGNAVADKQSGTADSAPAQVGKARSHREMTGMSNSLSSPASSNVQTKHKKIKEKKQQKDVLRLSDESIVLPQGLRYSDSLSAAAEPGINTEELLLARARLAAILRDENPDAAAAAKAKLDAQKIQGMQVNAQQLQRQNQVDKALLEELKKHSVSRNWIIGLVAFVLIGIIIIAGLMMSIRRLQKKIEYSWWDNDTQQKNPERKEDLSNLVDRLQASEEQQEEAGSNEPILDKTMPVKSAATVSRSIKSYIAPRRTKKDALEEIAPVPELKLSVVNSDAQTFDESNNSTFNFFATRGSSVKVEEISDVTQEAEFWISVNDPQRAIEILEPQVEMANPETPVPWLYLFDLYRSTKNKDKFDLLRARFVLFFNAKIVPFEEDIASEDERRLEDFPHLIQRICDTWGSHEMIPLLEGLLVDDRAGQRAGFELSVYRDILLLIGIANELERGKVNTQMSSWPGPQVDSAGSHAAPSTPFPTLGDELDGPSIIEFENIEFDNKID